MRKRSYDFDGWVVVAAVTITLTFTAGARLLPGVVLKPLTEEYGWSRSELMLAVTINVILMSLFQPFTGIATDRFGARRIILAGVGLIGLVVLGISLATELWQFYLIYGLFGALALAAVGPVNITPLISGWFERRRGAALSISTSGSAFGQLMIVPAATYLLVSNSWQSIYQVLAMVILIGVLPVAFAFIRESPRDLARIVAERDSASDGAESTNLRAALADSTFWLLAFGFFSCGFTMAFANAHFMAYADDMGMQPTRAADIVAVTALFSIIGSFVLGMAADRRPRQHVLSLTYALRGMSFVMLWLLPVGPPLLIYAIVLGISWTATTPLTAAIAADVYGRAGLGIIFGTMFSFMNIGFGAGSFLDGLAYDTFGNYRSALLANAVLGGLAALAVLSAHGGSLRARRNMSSSPDGIPTVAAAD